MAIFTALAVVGAAATAVGTYKSYQAQKEISEAQQQQEALTRRRSSMQAIRQAQLQRATAQATAVGAGSDGGSGFYGGIGSIGSQLGGAQGFSSAYSALSGVITKQGQKAAAWSGIGDIGGTALSYGAKYGGLDFLTPQESLPDLTRPL